MEFQKSFAEKRKLEVAAVAKRQKWAALKSEQLQRQELVVELRMTVELQPAVEAEQSQLEFRS